MDKGTEEKVVSPLISKEKRYDIVRSFIDAYIRGSVKIDFPTERELEGKHDDVFKDAFEAEMKTKQRFVTLVNIATGIVMSTQSELENAIADLFTEIIALRTTKRIEGEFLETPRLASLEERVTNLERSFEELQNLIRIRGQRP